MRSNAHLLVLASMLFACDPGGSSCSSSEECGDGEYCCAAGRCVAEGTCCNDEDCGALTCGTSLTCEAQPPCTADSECATGQRCASAGRCIVEGTCEVDDDCEGGFCSVLQECAPDGQCLHADDCEMFEICGTDMTCQRGGTCGTEEFDFAIEEPNLLLVIDRSCSMTERVAPGGVSKWEAAVESLSNALQSSDRGGYGDRARYGLILFPEQGRPGCTQDMPAPFDIGPDNATPISELLQASLDPMHELYPMQGPCVTNIDTAVEQAEMGMGLYDETRSNNIILITDGAQGVCTGGATIAPTVARMLEAGITTYVVGFGRMIGRRQLESIAQAGGAPMPAGSEDSFYVAEDGGGLSNVLSTIIGGLIDCRLRLDRAVPDPSLLHVFFNDDPAEIPNGDGGWSFDPEVGEFGAVVLSGAACEQLRSGRVLDVDILFDCDVPVPDPPPGGGE